MHVYLGSKKSFSTPHVLHLTEEINMQNTDGYTSSENDSEATSRMEHPKGFASSITQNPDPTVERRKDE